MAEFDLATFLPYQLAQLSERVSKRLAVDYKGSHGLSVAQWRILVHLKARGRVSVRDLETYANLEKSRASRAVDRLAQSGLVAKEANRADRRLVDIHMTPKGAEVFAELLPQAKAVEAHLLEALSPAHRCALQEIFAQLHLALDADPAAQKRRGEGPRLP